MKQVLQDLSSGVITLADIPEPALPRGCVRIRTRASLLSAGTERMMLEFGRGNLLSKAMQQPDKVRMVLDKARTDGIVATFDAVRSKLDQPLALGYCNVGMVTEASSGVPGLVPGQRVVSNGKHAEVVCVPRNLCAVIPDTVSDEHAAFTVLAAIGLQGVRLVHPTMGECVVVAGLGLIGLLTVQLLRAQGCRVLGIDYDPARLALARQFGAETVDAAIADDVLAAASVFSRGAGVDAVLITASTKSSEPVSLAAKMCRKRGRIVLVGVTGLELSRADFYEKELTFQVSCSYGPGRYDPSYEEAGNDYPLGYVRWTEQRNFEAVLDLMAAGRIDVAPLISHRFAFEEAAAAYDLLAGSEASLGILLGYRPADDAAVAGDARHVRLSEPGQAQPSRANVAFIGAGNYGGRVLMPAFRKSGAGMHTVVSGAGVSAVHYGRKQGFMNASTDMGAVLADPAVDTVVIATRHDAHAAQVLAALRAGKHVFCEKPLCLDLASLADIEAEASLRPGQLLMLGFNRRFSPLVQRMKRLLAGVSAPKSIVMTVNAGAIPPEHWTQDRDIGGGRIVGEACHFIDLLRHLVTAPVRRHQRISSQRAGQGVGDDATLVLEFEDGSIGTIHYLTNGDKGFAKERVEVFCAGRVLQLDNFRVLRGWGWPGFSRQRLWRQDKGQEACVQAFVDAVRQGKASPIPLDELVEVSRIAIEAQQG